MEKESKKVYDNEELFYYPKDFKLRPEILQLVYFVLSMVSVFLAFTVYEAALPLSAIVLTVSAVLHFRRKSVLTYAAIIASAVSLAVSLFILWVNVAVY